MHFDRNQNSFYPRMTLSKKKLPKRKQAKLKKLASENITERLKAELKHLKEASRSKDEFIRITNHELRTPLDIIRGNVDMVLKGETGQISKRTREYLQDVLLGADRLTKLVNTMLDVSRAESRRMQFTIEDVNTEEFLKNIYEEFSSIAKDKGIILYLKTDPDLPRITTDKIKLYEIMDNFLGNAIKFTPRGGTITIRGSEAGNMVRIAVVDTGIGIRAEDLPKLFKKFPDIDTNAIGAPKGNGLGLALVHQIATRLMGRLWAESGGLGKGLTFYCELPATGGTTAKKLITLYSRIKTPPPNL